MNFFFLFLLLAILVRLGNTGQSYISPFVFKDEEGHEIENLVVGIHKQDVNISWKLIDRFGKLGANMWPYGDRPSWIEFEAWLNNNNNDNMWVYFCQPAADPRIQYYLAQPANIEALRSSLAKAVSEGGTDITFMTPAFLKDLYCKRLSGSSNGTLNTKMIGYGTAWFVSPYGATPFLFEGRYDPKQHLYFCPHSNQRYYTALGPPPLCPKTVDNNDQSKSKLVRITIYVPQIVMFSRRCDVCYVKNTHVHTYENFWSAKEQCGVCPTTVDKQFINATTCRNWLPGKSCYWPMVNFMADVLANFMGGSSSKGSVKVMTDVGRFTKFDTGARTNNEIYYDYRWCGTKNYVITNCYRETGDITTRGPAFKTFDSRWGQLSWREALSGRAQVGPYKYSMHFKPFEEKLLCPYTPTVTVSNVRYTESDSKEFDLGVRVDAKKIITLTVDKLGSVFTVDDTQQITTAPKCLPKDRMYYHLSEDRIIMISDMDEEGNNSLHKEQKIFYHEGHSDLMKVQSGQEKMVGFAQSSKRTHALKTGPAGKPKRQSCADLSASCQARNIGLGLGDQVQFLADKIRQIMNYNARLADHRACQASRDVYENNRLLLRIFPSATMSKLLGQRVKVIGTGEKVFEILPCQPVERFSIVQSLKTNNRAFLDPRYAYRVFVNKDVILDSRSNPRIREILANSSAAGNGSENIVYLHHDVLQEGRRFGYPTEFPRRYEDVYTLLNLTVAPYACLTRPVVEFQDPYDPRVKFIGQVDRDSTVALDLPYMGSCKKDARHFFQIARIMFLFYQHQLIGTVSGDLIDDNKKRTDLAMQLAKEARMEAKHEMKHKILGENEPPPKAPLRDLSQHQPSSSSSSGSSSSSSSISLKEITRRMGTKQVYDLRGNFQSRSQLIDFITNLEAVEGASDTGKMHQLKKRYLFNVFDSHAYDLMKQFEKVEEQSYESVLKDLIIRTDVAQLSQIGEAGLEGGTDIPNITTLERYQQMLMARFHSGGGFGSAFGQGLHEVLRFGKDGLELVGKEVKRGAEGVVDFAANGVGNVIHKLFGGVFGKILIVLGSIAGVVLVVVVLFFLITRTQSRTEQKKTETRLANNIGEGGCAAGGEVWLNQSDENQFRQRKGYSLN